MNCLRLKDTILGIWNGWAWWGGIALNLGHPNRSSSSCYIYRVFQLMMVAFLAVNRRKTLMRGRLRRRNLLYWELLIILSWESTNPSWGGFFTFVQMSVWLTSSLREDPKLFVITLNFWEAHPTVIFKPSLNLFYDFISNTNTGATQCLKIKEKVAFNIAKYVYIFKWTKIH